MKLCRKLAIGFLLGLVVSFFAPVAFADLLDLTTQSTPQDFNHIETGFPLAGAHQGIECISCHVANVFKGTPRNCAGCHSKGSRFAATFKPQNHIVTTDPCETCHVSTATFAGAKFSHGNVQAGFCTSCHNGFIATAKPASHRAGLQVTQSCDHCHRTFAWSPASFDHAGITPGSCATQCHTGSLATGRPASHTSALKSTSSCDACHRYSAWLPTFYNHTSVTPGSCATCHNGSTATGKPASHNGAKSAMACDSCHNTAAWQPAVYNHAGVAAASCANCHAAQRPTDHVTRGFTAACDICHSIGASWTFNHALQQGLHMCNSCHVHHNNSTPCDLCHSVNHW